MPKHERPVFFKESDQSNDALCVCQVNFPIYSLCRVNQDTIVVGGGGGPSKTGVQNGWIQLRLHFPPEHPLSAELTLPLQPAPDAVLSISAFSTDSLVRLAIAAGPQCQVGPTRWMADTDNPSSDGYVRWIEWWSVAETDHQYILTLSNCDNCVTCWDPAGSPCWQLEHHGKDYKDADVLPPPHPLLAIISAEECELYEVQMKKGKMVDPLFVAKWTLPEGAQGRRVLIGRRACFGVLAVLMNYNTSLATSKSASFSSSWPSLSSSATTASSHLLIYDISTDRRKPQLVHQLKVYHKPATVAAMSPDGLYLALGCSDGSVLLFQWQASRRIFAKVMTFKELHHLSVTCLVFDIASRCLVSGGPDHRLVISSLSDVGKGSVISSAMLLCLLRVAAYYILLPLFVIMIIVTWKSWQ